MNGEKEKLLEKVRNLIEIGSALSTEGDLRRLLEKILMSAKKFTSADGGTLYLLKEGKKLEFAITSSDSLRFHYGVEEKTPFPDILLTLPNGLPNEQAIVAYAANHSKTVHLADAYDQAQFDFTGPRLFDQEHGYRTKSVLALPLKNHEGSVIGVLQLINAYHPHTKKVVPFSEEDLYLVESLASEAGVAITNQTLIGELKSVFESFVRTLAKTIDQKSPFTGNHSRRVPIVAEYLAEAVNTTDEGPLKESHLSEKEIYALKLAAYLHDCGKIITPVHIMNKHTKLETVFDRLELIQTRFEVLKREALIARLVKKLEWYEKKAPQLKGEREEAFKEIESNFEKEIAKLNLDLHLIEKCNKAEFVTAEMAAEVRKMGSQVWKLKESLQALLTPDEIENLTIPAGNLTDKERKIIEHHVVVTKNMLSEIPFPKDLAEVPEIAGNHHERMDGKGYPRGLKKEDLSLSSRILTLADIFEALSAPDRPYKEPLPLSHIHEILQQKGRDGHLDPDLVDVFLKKKVGLRYAKEHLSPTQIDVLEGNSLLTEMAH